MSRYLLFNKPYQVLTQFTDPDGRKTLADFIPVADVYSAGRLDYDSEGLLILTDDGQLIHSLMDPKFKMPKTYYAQVEGIPEYYSLAQMRQGLQLKDGPTHPCQVRVIEPPTELWSRTPPIRERKQIPTTWLAITITEGRNRQVRRMTAAIGYPTLRLVRWNIGEITVSGLPPGTYQEVDMHYLQERGVKVRPKKSSPKAASVSAVKRPGQRPLRSRRPRNQSRKA